MGERSQDGGSRQLQGDQRAEPVRPRWIPKREQVHILETIFDNGLINPRKAEMVRIQEQLEKLGPVADINLFYWFQNRRSRTRRRQRQIEAQAPPCTQLGDAGIINPNDNFVLSSLSCPMINTGPCLITGSTSSPGPDRAHYSDEFLSLLTQSDLQQVDQQSEVITVVINGIVIEVGREGLDIKDLCGGNNFMMYHSSGVQVQVNEYGFLDQDLLIHGEIYILVPKPSCSCSASCSAGPAGDAGRCNGASDLK